MLQYFFGRHGSIFCTEILSHRLRHQNLKSQIGGPSSVCLVSLDRMRRAPMTMIVFGKKKKKKESGMYVTAVPSYAGSDSFYLFCKLRAVM